MGSPVLDPDGARERLEAWKGRVDKLAADTKVMSDRYQDLQVSTTDRDGMAEVTVDSTGSLIGLRLTRRIEGVEPDVVAGAIMSTIRSAKAELAERAQEIIEETVGTGSPAGRAIAESVTRQLRGPDLDDEEDDVVVDNNDDGGDDAPALRATRPVRSVRDDGDEDDADELTWRS